MTEEMTEAKIKELEEQLFIEGERNRNLFLVRKEKFIYESYRPDKSERQTYLFALQTVARQKLLQKRKLEDGKVSQGDKLSETTDPLHIFFESNEDHKGMTYYFSRHEEHKAMTEAKEKEEDDKRKLEYDEVRRKREDDEVSRWTKKPKSSPSSD